MVNWKPDIITPPPIMMEKSTTNKKKLFRNRKKLVLPGEIAALICLEAEYMCFTKGIHLINHSPSQKTEAPSHDEANMPTKNINNRDVMNPRPAPEYMKIFSKICSYGKRDQALQASG